MQTNTRKKLDLKPASILLLVIAAALACQSREVRDGGPGPVSTTVSQDKNALAERWLGKWNGPEGTFLEISKTSQGYQVVISNLDGPRTFPAEPVAEGLKFTRNGKTETIHAGSGQDTGMKWLLDKKNCLLIEKGEGWCRD